MPSVWFHMLDKLQQAAILPHQFWVPEVPSCGHAQSFIHDVEALREVLHSLATPTKSFGPIFWPDQLLIARLGVDLGNNKNGLKGWQQFLYKASPGFALSETQMEYSPSTQELTGLPQFEFHIPHGGLALIDRYNKKMRALTAEISEVSSLFEESQAFAHQRREIQILR